MGTLGGLVVPLVVAAAIGFGGTQSRRLQTGMSHHYYTQIALGTVVAVLVVAIWR